jgi:hypothetical protein
VLGTGRERVELVSAVVVESLFLLCLAILHSSWSYGVIAIVIRAHLTTAEDGAERGGERGGGFMPQVSLES